VDFIACDGRGLCAEALPELITLDDWGFPIVSGQTVPPRLRADARETVRACPKLALRLDTGARWPRSGGWSRFFVSFGRDSSQTDERS
jgi:ferredoxin